MAPSAKEGAMPDHAVPRSFPTLLAAFAPCFGVPSHRTFQWLVISRVYCRGRRTITAVALASGAFG